MQRDMSFPDVVRIRDGATPTAVAVLVKFTFTNPKWIPEGIPQQDRQADPEMDAYHAKVAATKFQNPGLGEIGRHRANRVDTGKPTIHNAQQCHASILRRGMRNNGFVLANLFWYENNGKYIVVAAFQPLSADTSPDMVPELPRQTLDALRALSQTTWSFVHVWENPDGKVTVNFVGRMHDQKPKRAIIVHDGALEIDLVSEITSEEAEAEESLNAAFAVWNTAGFNPHITDTRQVANKIQEVADQAMNR